MIHFKKNIKVIAILLIALLIAMFLYLGLTYQRFPFLSDKGIAGMTAIICFLSIPITLKLSGQSIYSFLSVFLVATYIFTNSSFILYALGGVPSYSSVWKLKDLDVYILSSSYYVICFLSLMIGAIIGSFKYGNRQRRVNIFHPNIKLDALYAVGVFIIAISVFVSILLILRGEGLALIIEGNYGDVVDAREGKGSTLTSYGLTIYYWFLPWASLILIILARDRSHFYKNIVKFLLPTILVNFLLGRRTEPLIIMGIAFSIAYIRGFIGKINTKQLILGILIALSVPVIGELRSVNIKDWNLDTVISILSGTDSRGSLGYSMLSEFGINTQSLGGTMLIVPEKEPHRFGYDYIKSMYNAIPFSAKLISLPEDIDFGKFEGGIHPMPNRWFTYHYNYTSFNRKNIRKGIHITGLGYQQIAEVYLEFGGLGIVFFYILFGFIITRWWYNFTTSKEIDYQYLIFISFLMIAILSWIRNDVGPLFRNILYGALIIYILPQVLNVFWRVLFTKKQISIN
jgi:hypothetical protein